MLTGLKFLRAFANVVLGNSDWNDALAVTMTDALQAFARRLGPTAGVFQQIPVFLELDGMTPIRTIIGNGTHYFLANGAVGVISEAEPWWDLLPYTGLGQYMSLTTDEYPEVADVSLEGTIGWKQYKVGVGEALTPSAVVEDSDGLLFTVAAHPAWANTAIKRLCRVWKVDPVTSTEEALYDGDLEILDGAVKVAVDHQFGQASPSLVAADYRVFVHGPCFRSSAAAPTTTHAHLCRLMLVLPDSGDHRCADLNQHMLNTLTTDRVRAVESLVQDAPTTTAITNSVRAWTARSGAVKPGPVPWAPPHQGTSANALVWRFFAEGAEPDDSDEPRRFALFGRGVLSDGGLDHYFGFRLFQEDGEDATDIAADETVHAYLGGPGDLGLAATHPSEAALSVVRNGTLAVLDKVEPDGGSQVDETETGLKAVHKVGDLQLLGANGKLVTRCLPLTHATLTEGFVVNAGPPLIVNTGSGDGEAFLGWEAIVGRKLVKVTVNMMVSGDAGDKVAARLYRLSEAGGFEYIGDAVEWTAGESGSKDVTPTSETTYATGYQYGIRFGYATATAPSGCGLRTAEVVERLFSLQ